jgi:hypothetical protein
MDRLRVLSFVKVAGDRFERKLRSHIDLESSR